MWQVHITLTTLTVMAAALAAAIPVSVRSQPSIEHKIAIRDAEMPAVHLVARWDHGLIRPRAVEITPPSPVKATAHHDASPVSSPAHNGGAHASEQPWVWGNQEKSCAFSLGGCFSANWHAKPNEPLNDPEKQPLGNQHGCGVTWGRGALGCLKINRLDSGDPDRVGEVPGGASSGGLFRGWRKTTPGSHTSVPPVVLTKYKGTDLSEGPGRAGKGISWDRNKWGNPEESCGVTYWPFPGCWYRRLGYAKEQPAHSPKGGKTAEQFGTPQQ